MFHAIFDRAIWAIVAENQLLKQGEWKTMKTVKRKKLSKTFCKYLKVSDLTFINMKKVVQNIQLTDICVIFAIDLDKS